MENISVLHTACQWSQIEVVEMLFEAWGEKLVRMKNNDGEDAVEFSLSEN